MWLECILMSLKKNPSEILSNTLTSFINNKNNICFQDYVVQVESRLLLNTADEFVSLLNILTISLPTCFPKILSYYRKDLRYKGEEK